MQGQIRQNEMSTVHKMESFRTEAGDISEYKHVKENTVLLLFFPLIILGCNLLLPSGIYVCWLLQ